MAQLGSKRLGSAGSANLSRAVATLRSAPSRRRTMRRSSCRVSRVSRGRIMLSCGLSARGLEGRLLDSCDKYKREANRCVDHLTLIYARYYTRTLLGAAADDLISPKSVLRQKLEPNLGTSTVRLTSSITNRYTEWTGPSPTKGHIIVTR